MIDHASFSDGRRRFLMRGVAALGMFCGLGTAAALAQASGEPVTIGVSGPLTGQNAQYGAQWKAGFDLALVPGLIKRIVADGMWRERWARRIVVRWWLRRIPIARRRRPWTSEDVMRAAAKLMIGTPNHFKCFSAPGDKCGCDRQRQYL